MPTETFVAYAGVYTDVSDALADYDAVKLLHTEAGLIEAYDAAVIEKTAKGKVKIVKKHETPTRAGGVGGAGVGLATGLVVALFPAAAIGTGLLAATTGAGAALGAWAGHAAGGMKRSDLKDLGERLDAGEAGLVVVALADLDADVEEVMSQANEIDKRELEVDVDELDADVSSA
jgi:uncharacterized membrane protein